MQEIKQIKEFEILIVIAYSGSVEINSFKIKTNNLLQAKTIAKALKQYYNADIASVSIIKTFN